MLERKTIMRLVNNSLYDRSLQLIIELSTHRKRIRLTVRWRQRPAYWQKRRRQLLADKAPSGRPSLQTTTLHNGMHSESRTNPPYNNPQIRTPGTTTSPPPNPITLILTPKTRFFRGLSVRGIMVRGISLFCIRMHPAVGSLGQTRCATDSHSHWSQELCCFRSGDL